MNDLGAAIDQRLRSDGRRACSRTEWAISAAHRFVARGLPQAAINDTVGA